jgi:XTP/dITP diphosphohydrolase
MRTILIATSNTGKLRDFAAAAAEHSSSVEHGPKIQVGSVPDIEKLRTPREDAPTFEANACKKAEHYSRHAKNEFVLADDSGLMVEILGGAPGVFSARYALVAHTEESQDPGMPKAGIPGAPSGSGSITVSASPLSSGAPETQDPLKPKAGLSGAPEVSRNSSDEANNARLLKELEGMTGEQRAAKFVCAIAVARNGRLEACFRGEVEGVILESLRGSSGFGYDPLFFYPPLGKCFGELSPEEKAKVSHRGQAFRKFLAWFAALPEQIVHASQTSVTKQLAVRRE